MPNTTSIDYMVFSEVGDMCIIFPMAEFQLKIRPIDQDMVQYVHTAQIPVTKHTHFELQGYFGPLEV